MKHRPIALAALVAGCGADPQSSPDAAAPDAPAAPMEVAARTNVRFELAGSSGFAVIRGRSCRTFEVEREVSDGRYERVPLDLGVTCVCECPSPGAPASIGLTPLAATPPYAFTWDGRQMVWVERTIDCATRSFSVRGTATERVGALEPLPAGRYRVSVAVVDTVPRGCMELMDGYWCPPENTAGAPPQGPFALCPGRRVTTAFELPESGDVTVRVTAP